MLSWRTNGRLFNVELSLRSLASCLLPGPRLSWQWGLTCYSSVAAIDILPLLLINTPALSNSGNNAAVINVWVEAERLQGGKYKVTTQILIDYWCFRMNIMCIFVVLWRPWKRNKGSILVWMAHFCWFAPSVILKLFFVLKPGWSTETALFQLSPSCETDSRGLSWISCRVTTWHFLSSVQTCDSCCFLRLLQTFKVFERHKTNFRHNVATGSAPALMFVTTLLTNWLTWELYHQTTHTHKVQLKYKFTENVIVNVNQKFQCVCQAGIHKTESTPLWDDEH